MDPDGETNKIEQTPSTPTQENPPSNAIRKKYTKKLKELVQKFRWGHYKGNKYDITRVAHRYNTRLQEQQGKIVEPTAQHISVLTTNLQGKHQDNVVIDPTTGSSLEYRHIIKGQKIAIRENSFEN